MVIINGHATIAIAPYLSHMLHCYNIATAIKQAAAAAAAAATTTMNDVGSRTQRALSTAADAENLTVVVLTPVIMAKYYSIAISNRQQG